MQEIWKTVPGYEGYYDVSSLGRIRSHDRSTMRVDGKRFSKRGRILSLNLERKGYLSVRLCVERVHTIFKAHRLVALAFLPPASPGQQINHINGVKTDNRPENLEWVSAQENVLHAFASGLCITRQGVANGHSILGVESVLESIEMHRAGLSCAHISRHFGVSEGTIRNILKGRSWTHVTGLSAPPHQPSAEILQG